VSDLVSAVNLTLFVVDSQIRAADYLLSRYAPSPYETYLQKRHVDHGNFAGQDVMRG
jgi:hypothetical protein